MISPHFNELAMIQTLGSLCSHMLLILLNEEPLSPAGYLHQGKPMITMAIFILSTTSWVVYSYIFLNESQGDNMAYNTQSMHLLAHGVHGDGDLANHSNVQTLQKEQLSLLPAGAALGHEHAQFPCLVSLADCGAVIRVRAEKRRVIVE